MRVPSRAAVAVALVALTAACSDEAVDPPGVPPVSVPPASSVTPAASVAPTPVGPTATVSDAPDRAGPYALALSRTRDWLAAWARDGAYRAGQAYLEPPYRPATPAATAALISGRVLSFRPGAWTSADEFTLMVTFDLRFAADPGAWGQGTNTRFVTFTRHSPGAPYLLALATGP